MLQIFLNPFSGTFLGGSTQKHILCFMVSFLGRKSKMEK